MVFYHFIITMFMSMYHQPEHDGAIGIHLIVGIVLQLLITDSQPDKI